MCSESERGKRVCIECVWMKMCTHKMSSEAASKCRRRVRRSCSGGLVSVEAEMRGCWQSCAVAASARGGPEDIIYL